MTPAPERGPLLFLAGVDLSTPRPFAVTLPSADSHHLRDVLRLRVGDALEIADPSTGLVAPAVITSLTPAVTAEITGPPLERSPSRADVHLLFALCKGQKNELVVDWATELGCASIILWQAERSVVRLRGESECKAKETRFAKIAWSAAEQSRQTRPPNMAVTSSLAGALDSGGISNDSLLLWASLEKDATPLASALPRPPSSRPVYLVIGPEGDISPNEGILLRSRGFLPVSLGEQILRSELAAVTAIVGIHAVMQVSPPGE